MTVRLVILGLLRQRALYGYEIKQIIEDHMGDWTSIAFGSIYFALDKLAEEGYIEKINVEQKGKRPSRSVYEITQSGRDEFLRLLRESWQQIEQEHYDLDICLFFLDSLPMKEVKDYLFIRQTVLQETLKYIKNHRSEQLTNPHVPRLAGAIFDHSFAHTQAELNWLTDFLAKLESGEYE